MWQYFPADWDIAKQDWIRRPLNVTPEKTQQPSLNCPTVGVSVLLSPRTCVFGVTVRQVRSSGLCDLRAAPSGIEPRLDSLCSKVQARPSHWQAKYLKHLHTCRLQLHACNIAVLFLCLCCSSIYRVSQKEKSVFLKVIISAILSKNVYIHVSSSERFPRWSYFTVQTSNTPCPHMSCKVHWCWRWNFRKCIILGKLYQLRHLNNKYR
jgi:hypothetical protein